MIYLAKRLDQFGKIILCLVYLCLNACDGLYGVGIQESKIYSDEDFKELKGVRVTYSLYAPNAMQGWAFNETTALSFNESTGVYYKQIPLSDPPIDFGGLRFKICGLEWNNQLGFGEYTMSDAESTIGLTKESLVFPMISANIAAADLRFELQEGILEELSEKVLYIELKLSKSQPEQLSGLLRMQLK